ncbi:MAG: hypothetical protein B6A08_18205 [Sorangiineae bacterium NIC37A_2]|nr:MAG: hypothetical protein B6A08_18205 [Sorangiineae bacterium NIC37A_2]
MLRKDQCAPSKRQKWAKRSEARVQFMKRTAQHQSTPTSADDAQKSGLARCFGHRLEESPSVLDTAYHKAREALALKEDPRALGS